MAIISMFPAGGSGSGNTLHITFADSLIGSRYTITNGDETITGTVPSSGVVDVMVKGSGTYTVECGDYSSEIEVQSEYDVSVGFSDYIAFYSADDGSLNFCYADPIPDVGSTFLDKTVTTVYEGVKNTGTSSILIPWYSDRTNFKSIVFDESFADVKPAQTAYWFYQFTNCTSITGLEHLDTSNVTDMDYMFRECSGLTSLSMSNFNTSNVTSMSYMFARNSKLTSLNVSNFDTSNVTDMSYMFNDCSGLTSLDVSNFNTSKVTNISYMFRECTKLTSLSVSNFDTSKVTNMSYMFSYCRSLTSLSVSNFNTSNMTNMGGIFSYCDSLTSLSVSNFDTSKVTNMSNMFRECSRLTSLNVSNFDTSNVTDMSYMFDSCSGLTSLSVSNFDTSNVTAMTQMFYGCSNLTTIRSNDSKFVTTKVTNSNNMFTGCSNLVGGNGTTYDSSKVTSSMAHVDTASNPGYFT